MTSLFQTIFGGGTTGASEQSQEAQRAENVATEAFIREQSGLARADVKELFPQAQQARATGFQSALDLIAAGVDPQIAAFTQGNIGAQDILTQTPDQVRAAILGLPTTGFEVTPFNVDTSFLQNLSVGDLPVLEEIGGTSPPPPAPGRPPNNFDNILDILSRGGRGLTPGDIAEFQLEDLSLDFAVPGFNRGAPTFVPPPAAATSFPRPVGIRPDIAGTPVRLPAANDLAVIGRAAPRERLRRRA